MDWDSLAYYSGILTGIFTGVWILYAVPYWLWKAKKRAEEVYELDRRECEHLLAEAMTDQFLESRQNGAMLPAPIHPLCGYCGEHHEIGEVIFFSGIPIIECPQHPVNFPAMTLIEIPKVKIEDVGVFEYIKDE